jgi:hypothetical protein
VERPYQSWLRLGEKVSQAGWQGVADVAAAREPEAGTTRYDLDLSKMADDALTVLATLCGYHPAANELALRRFPLPLGAA